jgi:hypothetical protein
MHLCAEFSIMKNGDFWWVEVYDAALIHPTLAETIKALLPQVEELLLGRLSA